MVILAVALLVPSVPPAASIEGVWAAPSVRASAGPHGSVIYDVHGRHRLVVLPLSSKERAAFHAPALRELGNGCDTGWRDILSYPGDTVPNAFVCYARDAAEALLAPLADDNIRDVLLAAFQVNESASCATRPNALYRWQGFRRSWLTALHEDMAADVLHADGCDSHSRPSGHDFLTVLSWPMAEAQSGADGWPTEWGGHFEVAAQQCGDPAMGDRALSAQTPAILRVSPSARLLVVFSGPLLHRATRPELAAPRTETPPSLLRAFGSSRVPREARWRYSAVQQLTCPTGRDLGPYEADLRQWYESPHVLVGLGIGFMFIGVALLDSWLALRHARRKRDAARARKRE